MLFLVFLLHTVVIGTAFAQTSLPPCSCLCARANNPKRTGVWISFPKRDGELLCARYDHASNLIEKERAVCVERTDCPSATTTSTNVRPVSTTTTTTTTPPCSCLCPRPNNPKRTGVWINLPKQNDRLLCARYDHASRLIDAERAECVEQASCPAKSATATTTNAVSTSTSTTAKCRCSCPRPNNPKRSGVWIQKRNNELICARQDRASLTVSAGRAACVTAPCP